MISFCHGGDTLLVERAHPFRSSSNITGIFSWCIRCRVPRCTAVTIAPGWLWRCATGMVVLATRPAWLSMLETALLAGGADLLTRCQRRLRARASIDWSVLVMIGASLGLGAALQTSGAAQAIASCGLQLVGQQPWLALLVIYAITSLMTSDHQCRRRADVSPSRKAWPRAHLGVSLAFHRGADAGASASCQPIGYQTNLMVYGPGGYRFPTTCALACRSTFCWVWYPSAWYHWSGLLLGSGSSAAGRARPRNLSALCAGCRN